MKTCLRQIWAFALAALLLFSTLYFTVGLHYCGNHLVDIAINEEAKGCCTDMAMDSALGKGGDVCLLSPMPCCKDVSLIFTGHEDMQPASCASAPQPFYAVLPPGPPIGQSNRDFDRAGIQFPEYSPPPIIRDISILHQVMLI